MRNTPQFPLQLIVELYGIRPLEHSVNYLGNAGGFSGADFWRFESDDHGALCLRRWPSGTPAKRLAEVHSILSYAAAAGVEFLAVPRRDQQGETFFEFHNRLAELAPWIDGHADFHATPSPQRLHNAMAALARFHNAVAPHPRFEQRFQVAPGVVARGNKIAKLATSWQHLENAVGRHPWHQLAPFATRVLQRVKPRIPQIKSALDEAARLDVATQLCLRDIRHDHVLFEGDEVRGMIDYDAIRLDSVATDVTRLAQGLIGNDGERWKVALDAYSSLRPLEQNERCLIRVLQIANPVLSLLTWLEWLFVEGREFADLRRVDDRLSSLASLLD